MIHGDFVKVKFKLHNFSLVRDIQHLDEVTSSIYGLSLLVNDS